MLKRIFFMLSILLLFTGILSSSSNLSSDNISNIGNNTFSSYQHTKEELYQDIFITLLMPYIDKSIEKYYGEYFKYLPGVDPWSVKILDIKRPNGDRTSYFILKLEITPYIGPHISVGLDQITLSIKYGSKPKVEKFEHIKSYEVPPNYKVYIKKWPPPK